MSQETKLLCDRCGKRQTAKTGVHRAKGNRDDGWKFEMDLCQACWKALIQDFGVRDQARTARRREFDVIPYEEIPNI